jgi:hypothetical protein
MAQDIGNAIKGSVRADFFWGSGEEAGNLAGRTNYNGRMWVLLPNSINPSTYNPNVSFSNNINNANNYNPNSIADIINR